MIRSRLSLPVLAVTLLAACEAAPTAPPALAPGSPALAAGGRGPVVASVTGHYESDLGDPSEGPDKVHHKFSFGALLYADASVGGNFQVTLHNVIGNPARRNVTFEVVCMRVDGNEAWIGGVIKAPRTDRFHGGYDIWHVIDGGEDGPDRVEGFIGVHAASQEEVETQCHLGPSVPAELDFEVYSGVISSQRGEVQVRDRR